MNLEPSKQINLYGLKNDFLKLITLFEKNKLPNKLLLSGAKGVGKSTLAYHLVNYIYSKNDLENYNIDQNSINPNNKSFRLIQNKSHPNFYSVDTMEDKKDIEISQIRKMISYTNKSSFNNLPKFILIDNVENLNKSCVNALLKVTEEPNDNIYFIFIHNNNKKILTTLKSRCIIFKINLSFNSSIEITNKILEKNIFDLINNDILNYYFTPGNYLNLINFANKNEIDIFAMNLKDFLSLLIDKNYYKKDSYIEETIYDFMQLYFLKIFINSDFKKSIMIFYENYIKKINDTHQFNLDKESLFLEFKLKILNA